MFKEYSSIENHYNSKWVNYFLSIHPELKDEVFILQEKIDGANFQVIISSDSIHFARRSGMLDATDNFYGWQNVVSAYYEEFKNIQSSARVASGRVVRLYGELYGKGIQKRVNYGDSKYFCIFDVSIGDTNLAPDEVFYFLDKYNLGILLPPTVDIVKGLEFALNYSEEFKSLLTPDGYDKDNFAEGFVIKPYHKFYAMSHRQRLEPFFIKKKNPKFKEVKERAPKVEDTTDRTLNYLFLSYLTENRLASVFSKEGVIQDQSEIGKYINFMIVDAKKDFMKDHEEKLIGLDEKEIKLIFGRDAGKVILPFLMDQLKEEVKL